MKFPAQITSLLENLSVKQRKAVQLLALTEKTQDEISKECGIGRNTLWRWRVSDEAFQKAEVALTAWSCADVFLLARREWPKQIKDGNWKAIEKALDYGFNLAGYGMATVQPEAGDEDNE